MTPRTRLVTRSPRPGTVARPHPVRRLAARLDATVTPPRTYEASYRRDVGPYGPRSVGPAIYPRAASASVRIDPSAITAHVRIVHNRDTTTQFGLSVPIPRKAHLVLLYQTIRKYAISTIRTIVAELGLSRSLAKSPSLVICQISRSLAKSPSKVKFTKPARRRK